VYTHRDAAAAKGAAARQHILQHFTPEVVADSVLAAVKRIQRTLFEKQLGMGTALGQDQGEMVAEKDRKEKSSKEGREQRQQQRQITAVFSATSSSQCSRQPLSCNQGRRDASITGHSAGCVVSTFHNMP
jgi:hypothetical protein